MKLPSVIGHRGAAGLAPENTLAGFRLARNLGVEWVEFDVRLTADRRCVVMHDRTLDRTTDGSGPVDEATLEGIAACDAGSWFDRRFAGEAVPTLEETLDLLAALGLGANVELKPESGQETELAEAACGIVAGMWRGAAPIISSFSVPALAAARQAAPDLRRGLLLDDDMGDWRALADEVGAATIHCRHSRLTRARTAEMRAAGFPVLAYTVNHAGRFRELAAWGVASVFSDRPDRLLGFATAPESTI
ncbi:MAG TPA: glycerophosphodiester phosphodiesterase family protein [Stellaceae bacterium]|nr:glycerophosphodiester phosphodiesterase family protein [Stellaceae bacterium]